MFRAVDRVTVRLREGQTIGIVGESGSGKSTLGRALLRLIPGAGYYRFGTTDISGYDRSRMRPLRKAMQLVFQDPYGSLSPRQTVGEVITEGLLVHEPDLGRAERGHGVPFLGRLRFAVGLARARLRFVCFRRADPTRQTNPGRRARR